MIHTGPPAFIGEPHCLAATLLRLFALNPDCVIHGFTQGIDVRDIDQCFAVDETGPELDTPEADAPRNITPSDLSGRRSPRALRQI